MKAPIPSNEQDRLKVLLECKLINFPLRPHVDRIVNLAAQICGTPIALVSIVEENRQYFLAKTGIQNDSTSRDVSFCAHAILQPDEVFIVSDTLVDERFRDNSLVTGEPGIRFYAGVPLLTQDGYPLGTLCVIDRVPRQLSEEQLATLQALGHLLSSSLNHERNVTLEVLQDSQNRANAILKTALDAIIVADKDGCILEFNPAAEQIFGYRRNDILGKTLAETIVPLHLREHHIKGMARYLASGKGKVIGQRIEITAMKVDGSEFPVELAIAPVMVAGETIFIGDIRDITERKRTEQALRASEAHLQAIVDNVLAGIITIDDRGVIQSYSAAAEAIFGYTVDEVVGRNVNMLMPEPDHRQHDGYIKAYLKTGTSKIIGISREVTGLRKDGTLFPMDLGVSEICLGEHVQFVGIIRDITARKQAEEEIRRRTVLLEAANAELDAFAYSVSHDLRAPLRSLDGFSRALKEDYGDRLDGDALDYLDRISNASHRMGKMIDDILALSRATRGEMRFEEIDLSGLSRSILAELSEREPERQVACEVTPQVTAQGDPRLLRIVMENLLGNAWKFTSKHGTATIEFGATQQDDETVYFVRDDGAGFNMDYADKLFGIFQRLHAMTEFEGTGIGLATVARLIHRHGGRVWAQGAEEQGATFYFTLGR